MDALPDDILLLILGRFDEAKDLAQLELVSRRWWQLCKHVPMLTLEIPRTYKTRRAGRLLERVLSGRYGLQEVLLSNEGWSEPLLGDEIVKRLPKSTIERLRLQLGNTLYTTIWTSLATEFPKVSLLDIKSGRIEQSPDGCLFRNLHECRLWSVRGFSSASLEALVKACPALYTLYVYACDDVDSPVLSLDSKSLQRFEWRPYKQTQVVELRTPSLKKLCLVSSHWAGVVQQGFLCDAEFWNVDRIFSATIEALVKTCPLLRTLRLSYCPDLRSPMSLESTSLKELTIEGCKDIEGYKDIEAVELRTCNLEKLSLKNVRRVTIYEEALNSIILRNSVDVYAPPMRHLSKLKIEGKWSCCPLKKLMPLAKNIRHLAIDADISDIEAISKDDLCQFSQLEQFYLASDLLRVICARFRDWEPPVFAVKVMVIDVFLDDDDDDIMGFQDNLIMFVKGILKCSPSLTHLIAIVGGPVCGALEEFQTDHRFHLKDGLELLHELPYESELHYVISNCRLD